MRNYRTPNTFLQHIIATPSKRLLKTENLQNPCNDGGNPFGGLCYNNHAMKALSKSDLEIYASYLSKNLEGRHLSSPILYTEKAFFYRLSGKGGSRFSIVLDEECPRVYIAEESIGATSITSHFFDQLKKEIVNPYIEKVETYGEDRILKFSLIPINNVFKEEKRNLYIELFPHHPNLVVTDEDNRIILCYKVSHADDERPLLKGMTYEAPKKNKFAAKPSSFDPKAFEEECYLAEEILSSKRKNDRFAYLFKALRNRKKLLERKLVSLDKDIAEANTHLDDGRFGDAIYMSMDEIAPKASSFVYEGEEIKLDPSRSAAENANAYYKRAKKAKMTLKQVDISKEKTSKELEEITASLSQLEHADELGLEIMAKELDMAIVNQSKKKGAHEWRGLSISSLPYYAEYKGTKILFGKTSKQNDCLTFLFETAKDHLWFHVMGNSGSHVIIKKDDPSEEEINIAASIALLNSKQEEGEVMMAFRKDVRKGSVSGQAVVKTFKTLRLNKLNKETKKLLSEAKRYSF